VLFRSIVAATAWAGEQILTMRPGETVQIASYSVTLDGFGADGAAGQAVSKLPVARAGPNYRETVAHFTVRDGGTVAAVMEPAKRDFAARATTTSESALATFWPSQLYISLGDIAADGATTVRIYWKPLVTLIWLGAVVMALGGLFSLSDRRLRVGAPRPARAAVTVPAE
jgi:cytochrome c-type biogenesis protein CcmF